MDDVIIIDDEDNALARVRVLAKIGEALIMRDNGWLLRVRQDSPELLGLQARYLLEFCEPSVLVTGGTVRTLWVPRETRSFETWREVRNFLLPS